MTTVAATAALPPTPAAARPVRARQQTGRPRGPLPAHA